MEPQAKEPQADVTLKEDSFGRVERVTLEGPSGVPGAASRSFVRRVACGGRIPGSAFLARRLLARERRALGVLEGLGRVPSLVESGPFPAPAHPNRVLHRSWLTGVPLYAAEVLPEDFFERLEDLVRAVHGCGVCHNDLHKEGNVIVGPAGEPGLVDFQLASVHPSRGRAFGVRCKEDLRHVNKQHRRYLAAGKKGTLQPGFVEQSERSTLAAAWMRFGKPIYNFITRRVLGVRDGEPRRKRTDDWPRWEKRS
jgi:hypothetical protein